MAFTLQVSDIHWLNSQTLIAEQHTAALDAFALANGRPATNQESANILLQLVGGNPAAAAGIRTIDGTLNNLPPGNPNFSSTGQSFPRLTAPVTPTGDLLGTGGFAGVTNTVYTPGATVADAQPRFISNVVSTQTTSNQPLADLGIASPAIYSHWNGSLDAMLAANLLVPHATLPGVYVETVLDYSTNLPVLNAQNQPIARPFGEQMNAQGQLVSETGHVILNVPQQPLNIDQGPLNGWFTLFGQGFDHGLDFIPKSNNGNVFIPLQPSDPLYVPGAPTNFMVMPRASANDPNLVTAWVDMNQAFGSSPSFTVFLQEYVLDANNRPVPTGKLLSGANGGLPTWADIKAQARNLLGIDLTDAQVGNCPEVAVDDYGHFIPSANGMPMVVFGTTLQEGNRAAPIDVTTANQTGQAFLLDIGPGPLDAHFIAGDGRVNENNGLTAFHTIFHNLQDELVLEMKTVAVNAALNGDLSTINTLLAANSQLPAGATQAQISNLLNPASAASWNGERLFDNARQIVTGTYQHIAFQEFSRVLQPTLNLFKGGGVGTDSNIPLEFSQATYRFGHSMLAEEVQRLQMAANLDGTATWTNQSTGLIEAFVNPAGFTRGGTVTPRDAAGSIINGMARQVAQAIDPSVTPALQENLVGLPLDLAALNIARGRDVQLPPLNSARAQFFAQTNDPRLAPYTSWNDFAYNTDSGLLHPEAVVNYMAAYGTHPSIAAAATIEAKRAAAIAIWSGVDQPVLDANGNPTFNADGTPVVAATPGDAADYMNATGAWAGDAQLGGLNAVDYWIGGLGERPISNVDRLGSTFAYVFEKTIVNLQGNDRFYYLGLFNGNILSQIEQTTLNRLAADTTSAYHLPGVSFLTAAWNLESIQGAQLTNLAADGVTTQSMGNGDPVGAGGFPLVNRATPAGLAQRVDHTLIFNGGAHVVLGGSADRDYIRGGGGGDTLYGDANNDILITGAGADFAYGGDGDDLIIDTASPLPVGDLLLGDAGNDVIQVTTGLSISFGGTGSDYMIGGSAAAGTEQSGDQGNDFIQAATGGALVAGGADNDWLEDSTATAADIINGEHGAGVLLSPTTGLPIPGATEVGHDVIILRGGSNTANGDAGDDIIVDGESPDLINGSAGFDWVDNRLHRTAVNQDLSLIPAVAAVNAALPQNDLFDGFVEAAAGSAFNDLLFGDDRSNIGIVPGVALPGQAGPVPPANAIDNTLFTPANNGGVELIRGLWNDYTVNVDGVNKTFTSLMGRLAAPGGALEAQGVADLAAGLLNAPLDAAGNFIGGNILIGGSGDDVLAGKGGTDIIDGDASLQEQIVYTPAAGGPQQRFASMADLNAALVNLQINPSELSIERSLVRATQQASNAGTGDTAVFRGLASDYAIEGMVWDPNAVNRADGRLGTFVPTAQASAAAVTPVFQPQVFNDGFMAVVHDPAANAVDALNPVTGVEAAAINDGTDYVRNIEFLRFENASADPTQWTVIDLRPTTALATADPLVGITAPAVGTANIGENPLLTGIAPAPTDTTGTVTAPNNVALTFFATEQVGGLSNANAATDPTLVPEQLSAAPVPVVAPLDFTQAMTPAQQQLNTAGSALIRPIPAPQGGGTGGGGGTTGGGGTIGGGGTTGGGGAAGGGGGGGAPSSALVQTPVEPAPAPAPAPAVEPRIQLAEFNIEQVGQVGSFRDGSGYGAQWLDASKEAVSLGVGGKLKGYKLLGTEESGSGYESMLKKGSKYAIAQFGESGELISSKSVKKTKLSKLETRFEQDFNGDGVVGRGAALKSAAQLQAGDVLIGEAGRQMYALANQRGDLYASAGDADALSIQNFRTGADGDVLIASAGSEYSLGMVGDSAAIYKVGADSERDLVAVLEGVTPTAGMHVNFSFV